MKKLCLLKLILLSNSLYSFQINDLNFGKNIERGKSESKNFIIKNETIYTKKYKLEIEDKSQENIRLKPSILKIEPSESKSFKIEISGQKPLGKYKYFLVIKELKEKESSKTINLNKIIRIQQDYTIR